MLVAENQRDVGKAECSRTSVRRKRDSEEVEKKPGDNP